MHVALHLQQQEQQNKREHIHIFKQLKEYLNLYMIPVKKILICLTTFFSIEFKEKDEKNLPFIKVNHNNKSECHL